MSRYPASLEKVVSFLENSHLIEKLRVFKRSGVERSPIKQSDYLIKIKLIPIIHPVEEINLTMSLQEVVGSGSISVTDF